MRQQPPGWIFDYSTTTNVTDENGVFRSPDPLPGRDYAAMWSKFKSMQAESAAFLAPVYAKAGSQEISSDWVEREAEKGLREREDI